ncbi:MAG: hypothetical protein K2Q22_10280, partial [Cytophagales bacterium]|nr:hypothetical protein [Cytophagales bacterium]
NCGQKSSSTLPNNNPNGQLVATYTSICTPGSRGTAVINILKGTGPYNLTYGGGPVTSNLTVTGLPLVNTNITVSDLGSGFTTTLGVYIACSTPITDGDVNISIIGTTSSGLPVVRADISPTVTVTRVTWSTGDVGLGPITVPGHILTTIGFITATFTDPDGNSITKIQTFATTCSGAVYTPNISFTSPSCAGGTNGTLTLNNPQSGATNTWSGNIPTVLTGNSLNGLSAGTYSLTITKPSGVGGQVCLVYNGNGATISQPSALTASINQTGNTFTAISSGGTAPVSFLWTTSATSPTVSLQNSGTYFVTITDSKGCTAGDYVVVSPPLCLGLISVNSTAPGCVNGADGILKASSTLAGAYYNWSGPSVASPNNSLISGLSKGSYVVTVSTPGCSAYVGVELTDPPKLEVSHQYVGGKQVNIVVTGGSPNYSVKWRNDNLLVDN